jgi:sugar lactone lactonase YvrE
MPFALALGGPDRRTLFVLTAEWRSNESIADNLDRLTNGPRTGAVLTVAVEIPGAGRP